MLAGESAAMERKYGRDVHACVEHIGGRRSVAFTAGDAYRKLKPSMFHVVMRLSIINVLAYVVAYPKVGTST